MTGHDPLSSVREALADDAPPAGPPRRATAVPPPVIPAEPVQDTVPAPSSSVTTAPASRRPGGAPRTGEDLPSPRGRTAAPDRGPEVGERTGEEGPGTPEEGHRLPGYRRGERRQVGVNLSARCAAALVEARGTGRSSGDVVLEALRAHHQELATPGGAERDPSDPFPPEPPRRRRLRVEEPRKVEFMCSPAQARVIAELAERAQLSVSELVERALQLHLHLGDAPGG